MREIVSEAVHHNWAFWVCLVTSIFLIVVSFFTPPKFIIDGSILAATGELFGFAALANISAAIARGLDAKIEHNGTSITVGDLNKDKEENTYDA